MQPSEILIHRGRGTTQPTGSTPKEAEPLLSPPYSPPQGGSQDSASLTPTPKKGELELSFPWFRL